MPDSTTQSQDSEPEHNVPSTAETSGITRLSRTESETEGAHLRRVADELSGSGEERIAYLKSMLASRHIGERVSAARDLGKIGSLKAIYVLREMLTSQDENSWKLAIHGLRTGGSREGWLCLEGVAQDDAWQLAPGDREGGGTAENKRASDISFRRIMAMGRTKMMDRLFRAADGHSRSIPGNVAKQFSIDAIATLPALHKSVMELRLGLGADNDASATPSDTAWALGMALNEVRTLELEGWQSIHSPIEIDAQ
ncbi:MAG: hypothetical protein V3T49_09865 [Dehalococcoidia bacterium]